MLCSVHVFRVLHVELALLSLPTAIIREQVTANVVPVEQAIGDYLAGANDREGGRAERMAKKLHALAIQ